MMIVLSILAKMAQWLCSCFSSLNIKDIYYIKYVKDYSISNVIYIIHVSLLILKIKNLPKETFISLQIPRNWDSDIFQKSRYVLPFQFLSVCVFSILSLTLHIYFLSIIKHYSFYSLLQMVAYVLKVQGFFSLLISFLAYVLLHSVISWLFMTPWTLILLCPWDFPGKKTGVVCYFLLLGIFPTQGSNLCLLHWQVNSLPLCHVENLLLIVGPKVLSFHLYTCWCLIFLLSHIYNYSIITWLCFLVNFLSNLCSTVAVVEKFKV